jgi:hypothetical protein
MATTKHGSKKPSTSTKKKASAPKQTEVATTEPPEIALGMEEGKTLLEMVTVGCSDAELSAHMAEWEDKKQSEGWQLIATYFRTCADYNPELELGKAIARLNMLFQNSTAIQDFKACLAIQKEINKLLSLYAE